MKQTDGNVDPQMRAAKLDQIHETVGISEELKNRLVEAGFETVGEIERFETEDDTYPCVELANQIDVKPRMAGRIIANANFAVRYSSKLV